MNTLRVGCRIGLLAALGLMAALAVPAFAGPQDAEEWRAKDPIEISVSAPADNTYRSINSGALTLTASAIDCDEYRVGTTWYTYSDNVTTGDTESTYHIKWTKEGDGTLTDAYGTTGQYVAPDYSAGNNLRSVTISAKATDRDISPDTYGFKEGWSNTVSRTVKIWQVTLATKQSSQEDPTCNDGDFPAANGGIDLGQRDWGDTVAKEPSGTGTCLYYCLNTQITGTMDSDSHIPTATFGWHQNKKGTFCYTNDGNDWDATIWCYSSYVQDGPEPKTTANSYVDQDSHDTEDTPAMPDVDKIYARDAPGLAGGSNNKAVELLYPDAIGYSKAMTYKTWATYGSVRVSNELEWEMKVEIGRENTNDTWERVAWQDHSGD